MQFTLINTLYPPYQVGGAEVSVSEIAEFLATRGYVEVLTLKSSSDYALSRSEVINGVMVRRFPLKFRYWPFPNVPRPKAIKLMWHLMDVVNPALFIRVFFALKKNRPTIVMTHNLTGFSLSPWLAAKILKIPNVHLTHDYNLLCPKTTMRRESSNCHDICFQCRYRRTFVNSIPKPKLFLGVSAFILNQHQVFLRFPKSTKFGVVHGSARFTPKPRTNVIYDFGFIGSLSEVKGIEFFIEAAKVMPDKTFAVAGHPNEIFLKKIAHAPNIQFLGWCEADDFYSLVRVLVVPSVWNDPAPRVILEAIHAGVHLVVSNLPSLVEIAEYNNGSYDVFEPGNSVSLVEVLRKLSSKNEIKIRTRTLPSQGEQVFEQVIQNFSIWNEDKFNV